MNSITQFSNNSRYLPHTLSTRIFAVKMYRNGASIDHICRKYHISRISLWRWNKKYDGTDASLKNNSHRPFSLHPKSHSDTELHWIKSYIKRNPNISLCELWYKLKTVKEYSRHPVSLYRVLKKIGFYENNKPKYKKYVPQKYHTPENIGVKWQVDVKYVPKYCKDDTLPHDKNFYQYTCIDEASRERYIFHYEEQCATNTVDFINRCIKYYKYKPKIIQTDNGAEFTYFKEVKKKHPVDILCDNLSITHKLIKPRTPRHNGKVERSHRNDNERFYKYLKFNSLENLRLKAEKYLKKSNNLPISTLNYQTPNELRNKLSVGA